jgi:DNA-directed RNA polymerase specialized sigma24 family protein
MTETPLEALKRFNDIMQGVPARRAELILAARAAGHTWRDIAEALDMTEHGAIKASKPAEPRGRPRKKVDPE